MKISGRTITLDSNELAHAVDLLVHALGVSVSGPRTITIMNENTSMSISNYDNTRELSAHIYVHPSGKLVDNRKVIYPEE